MITETEDVRAALELAARLWPDDSPSQLLYRLIEEGQRALRGDVERKRQAITANAGALAGTFEAGYLERLHQEWPE